MSGIYDMKFDDFKRMCWDRWGIMVSQSWPTDAAGRVTDRREVVYKITFPVIDSTEEGEKIRFVGDDRVILQMYKLRDVIWKISHDRKINKAYYEKLERLMHNA